MDESTPSTALCNESSARVRGVGAMAVVAMGAPSSDVSGDSFGRHFRAIFVFGTYIVIIGCISRAFGATAGMGTSFGTAWALGDKVGG